MILASSLLLNSGDIPFVSCLRCGTSQGILWDVYSCLVVMSVWKPLHPWGKPSRAVNTTMFQTAINTPRSTACIIKLKAQPLFSLISERNYSKVEDTLDWIYLLIVAARAHCFPCIEFIEVALKTMFVNAVESTDRLIGRKKLKHGRAYTVVTT